MPLTLTAIALYVVLLFLNFITASISHHIKSFSPAWMAINTLNKLASLLIIPAAIIDIIRYIF